ncbi:MAG: 50S ribosomal protein L25 [Candidatus Doudnabacteria bacterium]|nr:50S ribosomal protein L25 [Candidatus Doudnabacteria bacterium]
MDKLQIKSTARDLKKSIPEKLRRAGKLPAVLYGNKVPNQNLTLDAREFDKILKKAGESTIVELLTEDGKTHPVLIHDVQIHYLSSVPTHVDFYEISLTQKLKAMVALEFTGEAPAVKTLGGVLVKILNEVEVECLPSDLPHNIVVALEGLKTLQDNLHVKDLKVPAKVKILTPADEMVIKVQPPRDVEAELAAPVVEDVSKVEGAAEIKPDAATPAASGDKAAKEDKPAKSGEDKK